MRQASSCSQILPPPPRIWQSNYSIVPPHFQFVGERFFKNSRYFAGNACFGMCFDLHFYSFRPLYQVWESETVIVLDTLSGNRELYEFKIISPPFQTAGRPRWSLALQAPQAGRVPPGP